ncbi:MAG: hypothetical protein AUJ92_21440 [Armatimonadetes bacterium CG2_30_59_28]|nr:gamma-glutamyl-gamma-aminobutyrate hydrolase family protein [Armatimonadota bacterium]OIO89455.1 MAG: hypothetical protein AUJ92_21440 [Armatimonadetes bacterium CG2_30_59_28]
MPRPLIGVTCSYRELPPRNAMHVFAAERYLQGIERAGGLPVVLPVFENTKVVCALSERIDGLLLTGGPDIPADYWGDETHEKADLARRERIDFELALFRHMLEEDKPVLGICLGHQLMNVALGGSLCQDIGTFLPDANDHRRPPGSEWRLHPVHIKSGSRLQGILGLDCVDVATSHHQVVDRVGRGLIVTAQSEDGLIEATELSDRRFVISVQWHPELLLEDTSTNRLFSAFTEATLLEL